MNAKQTEAATGISRRNLRFYEDQGLIHPRRNPGNDYRDYSEQDIRDLKMIRALRMLDVPLEEIGACLTGKTTLAQVSTAQRFRLEQRQKELGAAIRFCRELQSAPQPDEEFLDGLLHRMDAPENRAGLFAEWTRDYKKVARAEGKKAFSFTPDDPVTTPAELTAALCRYGEQQGVNLVVTRESMAPEFEIDGIPYTARVVYRRMGPGILAVVCCTALHPEQLESDVPKARSRWMKLLYNGWPLALFVLLWAPRVTAADPAHRGEVALAGAMLAVTIGAMYWVFRNFKS